MQTRLLLTKIALLVLDTGGDFADIVCRLVMMKYRTRTPLCSVRFQDFEF